LVGAVIFCGNYRAAGGFLEGVYEIKLDTKTEYEGFVLGDHFHIPKWVFLKKS
jgi:hypothetical protein